MGQQNSYNENNIYYILNCSALYVYTSINYSITIIMCFRTWIPQQYLSISHTMCPFKYDNESWPHRRDLTPLPMFYIDAFTHSELPITYSISVEPVQDFIIRYICDCIRSYGLRLLLTRSFK